MHGQGKQYFIHLYEHGRGDGSGIPAVEYSKPERDGGFEEIDGIDILMEWGPSIPDLVKGQLQQSITMYGDTGEDLDEARYKAKQKLEGLMAQHAVLLCGAYKPWNRVEVAENNTTVTPGGMLSLDGGVPHTVANTVSGSAVLVCALVGSRKNAHTQHFKNHESRSHTTTSLTIAIIDFCWSDKRIGIETKYWLLQRLHNAARHDGIAGMDGFQWTHAKLWKLYRQIAEMEEKDAGDHIEAFVRPTSKILANRK